jgi:hypothetical protein
MTLIASPGEMTEGGGSCCFPPFVFRLLGSRQKILETERKEKKKIVAFYNTPQPETTRTV